jgi:hypothetical protein
MNIFGKNLTLKKRSIPLNEKEFFCDIVDLIEFVSLRSDAMFEEMGVDTTDYDDNFYILIEELFRLNYGDWKTDIMLWYIWERKDKEGNIGLLTINNDDTDETEEIIVKTSEDLWNVFKKIEGKN